MKLPNIASRALYPELKNCIEIKVIKCFIQARFSINSTPEKDDRIKFSFSLNKRLSICFLSLHTEYKTWNFHHLEKVGRVAVIRGSRTGTAANAGTEGLRRSSTLLLMMV